MTATAQNQTFRRTTGNGTIVDPAVIRKYLADLCEQIAKVAKEDDVGGRIESRIIDISPTSFYAEIRFVELDGASGEETPFDVYRMVVKKRYYEHCMVSLTNLETGQERIIEADPSWIVACLTY
jgi:hypothetical protein